MYATFADPKTDFVFKRIFGVEQGIDQGNVQGKCGSVLDLFDCMKIDFSAEQRGRIESCDDPATRDRWFDRVIGASSAEKVLGK